MNKIKCLKTPVLVQPNMSRQEVSYLPSHFWSVSSEGIKIFKKVFHSFIDLGLHSDLSENEGYSTFVAKAGFFYAQKSI